MKSLIFQGKIFEEINLFLMILYTLSVLFCFPEGEHGALIIRIRYTVNHSSTRLRQDSEKMYESLHFVSDCTTVMSGSYTVNLMYKSNPYPYFIHLVSKV